MTAPAVIGWVIALPFIGAALVLAARDRPNLREALTIATGVCVLLLIASLYPAVQQDVDSRLVLSTLMPNLFIAFSVEPLGLLFCSIAGFLWIVTTVYSIGYLRGHNDPKQAQFFAFFAIAIGSTMGIALADNLLTLFIFYEVLTLSTYPLVTHNGNEEARRGGRVYLGILIGTSMAFFLPAVVWTYFLAGTVDFRPGGVLPDGLSDLTVGLLFALYVFGIGKAALMPFHRWLPAAMVAPAPVSALLHAVAVVKAGVFCILKVTLYTFGTDFILESGASDWLVWFAGATILFASLVAMTKDNLKARLAYSTVSQLSYIVLGALLATQSSILGSVLHIAMHAFAKITLFFAAGAILVAAHKAEISDMNGLGRAMPVTFGAFFIASLSMIGLPPFGGMWSKWYLGLGTIEAGQWLLLTILLVSSLLNIAYLLPVPVRAFFGKASDGNVDTQLREAPVSCLAAMIVTSLACLILFFYPEPFYQLATIVAGAK